MSEKKSFKETLNLPKTEFSIRSNAKAKEAEILECWQAEKLYDKAVDKNSGDKTFTLHDGPPFANGHMHMGHALNRTLKDITCKFKRMSGYKIVSFPGWDCHGLPIELKVLKELGEAGSDRVLFKKKCREYAQRWIDIQKDEIKRLGVVTDWDRPYITMSPAYEASILKSFAMFVEKGYIERKGKTVPWCASCQTVLATAEIEYQDKKDPSCYILFPLEHERVKQKFPKLFQQNPDLSINLLVWTTTPWTIPLNRAVVLHPTAPYVVLQGKENNQAIVVGEKRADEVCSKAGIEKKILARFSPALLAGVQVNHPYIESLQAPIILDDMVMLEDGTACVHSAPGCGPEDYFLGIKNNLEIFSPLSPDGKYTEDIEPKELEGMLVFDGQIWSIKKMAEVGRLFHKESIKHSYPHCWRCQSPLIFRATDQWFCDLQHDNLVERAIKKSEQLIFIPDWGKTRLTSSMASRTEWCLSRQRQWGVPITALICKKCDHAFLDPDFIRKVAEHVAKEGIEYWDRVTLQELIQAGILPDNFSCTSCGTHDLSDFEKEMDIVDVWFESGVSHTAVGEIYPDLKLPADLYLEGSDQHRGWFQSSLLSSMIMYDETCTKSFVTHAFVVDERGQKMSKSKGNVVSPQDVVTRYSADILRLWVAASDFQDDIIISEKILKNVAEVYRKIRNTCRFMISNLYDFDVTKDMVPVADMLPLDQYALSKLQEITTSVTDAYDKYWFTQVFHLLNKYCTNDLSSFYLDICKDRLYIEKPDGKMRRSAQTAIYHILDSLTHLMAPILSFLSEEVSDFYQQDKHESIHLQSFPEGLDIWGLLQKQKTPVWPHPMLRDGVVSNLSEVVTFAARMTGYWSLLETVRPDLLKAIEIQREKGLIKHSLEARVTVYVDESHEQAKDFLSLDNRFFKDFIIVSQFEFADSPDNLEATNLPWLHVRVEHADGVKCPRCWQWDTTDHPDELCRRCVVVLGA
ncbi:isoleucine--tRNA ligase [Candidatus Dependentiae bacterium]|nr:isoleucine--tRNA ligase [Candidatus Dependentiae bacterium]